MVSNTMTYEISDAGISVVYEPREETPIVDVLFVHGLQGHPFKTWACPRAKSADPLPEPVASGSDARQRLRNILPRRSKRKSDEASLDDAMALEDDEPHPSVSPATQFRPAANAAGTRDASMIFWPADLLPKDCLNARVLVFGYDTHVTKFLSGPVNTSSIYSHSKNLLYALESGRPLQQPLIFVAHSLGGIVVKEMLTRAAVLAESKSRDIVRCTRAVIFLGTPHRGSPDLANLGETARCLVSALQFQTSSTVLDLLGLKTTDLERAQESFSALWQRYGFRVKTFQESLGLTGLKLGALGKKVVPEWSSLIGDHREHPETIAANHMDMCRFSGPESPGFRQVMAELCSICPSIPALTKPGPGLNINKRRRLSYTSESAACNSNPLFGLRALSQDEQRIIQSLSYPTLHSRRIGIAAPAGGTCEWLFDHPVYLDWLHGRKRQEFHGLLRLTGNPGAGKSVLMKEAFYRAAADSENLVAGFFFDGDRRPSEAASDKLFRSLLYQLLPNLLKSQSSDLQSGMLMQELKAVEDRAWDESGCRSIFRQIVLDYKGSQKMFIFIDGVDQCSAQVGQDCRSLAHFWRDLTTMANQKGIELNVCLSIRPWPSVSLANCPDILVHIFNSRGIASYAEGRLRPALAATESQWGILRSTITEKAAGIFLWAVVVVDQLMSRCENGQNFAHLMSHIDYLPTELERLYETSLQSIPRILREPATRMFSWAVFAQKPLRIHEWHHIMAFIQQPAPKSLAEWRNSGTFTDTDVQLEKRIRGLSRGLIEVRNAPTAGLFDQDTEIEAASVHAGAGSLNLEQGETRVVGLIHESFGRFYVNRGSSILGSDVLSVAGVKGHMHTAIMNTCLDYITIAELDALIAARAAVKAARAAVNQQRSQANGQANASLGTRDPSADTCPSPAATRNKKIIQISGFDAIQERFRESTGVNITSWIQGHSSFAEPSSSETTIQPPSTTGQSQVLEDYPALLSYVASKFFTHARLVESEGAATPAAIILRLLRVGWKRLALLKETIPLGTSLRGYSESIGLSTWVAYIDAIAPPGAGASSYEPRPTARRRGSSVASFGSAGSHLESSSSESKSIVVPGVLRGDDEDIPDCNGINYPWE
ncbi:hypothetical protein QBC47DRAFT_338452 [Echria macrotheca]|uniref:Nephrocystin 3-like N-terminal domain-containing protein n=1 Tax=Echria macrotheca TaxID=438768 RepID=A0AAJ0BQ02_9PEZI|nr:hypothetical protein QBC47DRAFT_338452 [Echria macrotheca]